MKRTALMTAALALLVNGPARAENSVGISGNYYKERSTRVVEPLVQVRQGLPYDSQVEVTYLVDQITSASGAFTNEDAAFSEFRNEIRVAGSTKLWNIFTPGVSVRYSDEPDYISRGFGVNLAVELFKKSTVLSTFFQLADDDISSKFDPNYQEELSTQAYGLDVSQVLHKNVVGGLGVQAQVDRGFQENQYRVELHPRCRDRYAASAWIRTRFPGAKLTVGGSYRYYSDSWQVRGHSLELEFNQRIVKGLEFVPRFRNHTQTGVFFENNDSGTSDDRYSGLRECHLDNESQRGGPQQPLVRFSTDDPKLTTFDAQTYGAKLRWQQRWLRGTFLEAFETAWIEPAYYYFNQKNRYGAAHIAQLNFYWPY